MNKRPPRPQPAAKSKTDLRRGHFTPGHRIAGKAHARHAAATTLAEQAMLFDEGITAAVVHPHRGIAKPH